MRQNCDHLDICGFVVDILPLKCACMNTRLLAYFLYVFPNYIHHASAGDGSASSHNGSTVWTAGSGHLDGRRGEGGIRGADGLHPTPSINVGELNTRVFMYAVYHKLNPFMDVSDVAQICLLLTDFFIVWKRKNMKLCEERTRFPQFWAFMKTNRVVGTQSGIHRRENLLRSGRKVALISGIITLRLHHT